jgi:putative ABC transport system permease protein
MRILLRELHEVEPRRVVGVVDDVRDSALGEPEAALYLPDLRLRRLDFTFLVRTRRDLPDAGASVQAQIREIEKSLYVAQPIKLQDVVALGLSRPRFVMTISVLLAMAALLLASVGIGGVLYFLATRRIHELGIRMALGSDRRQLRRMLIVQQLRPVATGIAIGAGASYVLAPLMATQLHSVAPRDLGAFGAAVSAVFLTAVAACYLAARQATNIDVAQALRRG